MRTVAKLTRYKREDGRQFLAGRVPETVELPADSRLELRRSDLVGDEYDLVTTSCVIPGMNPARARAANAHDREHGGPNFIPY